MARYLLQQLKNAAKIGDTNRCTISDAWMLLFCDMGLRIEGAGSLFVILIGTLLRPEPKLLQKMIVI
jgi:hypothetical protein